MTETPSGLGHEIRRLLGLLTPRALVAQALLAVSTLASAAAPYLIKIAIDEAIPERDLRLLAVIGVAGAALYAVASITGYLGRWRIAQAGHEIWYALRTRLFDHVQRLPLGTLQSHRTGELVSRVHYDAAAIFGFATAVVPQVLNLGITVLATGVVLAVVAPTIALVCLVPLAVLVGLMALMRRRIRPQTREAQRLSAQLTATLTEALRGQVDIRTYGARDFFADQVARDGRELMEAELELARDQAKLFPSLNFALSLALLGILVGGGYMAMEGSLSVGGLVVTYFYLARALGPVRSANGIVYGWYRALGASDRIDQLLALPAEEQAPPEARPVPEGAHAVAMEEVGYRYEGGDATAALDRVSFDLAPGSRLAILGPSGAGKSTTGLLLLGLLRSAEGRVALGGRDLRDLDPESLRARLGYVGQEVFLFDGSLEENVRFGDLRAERVEVERAIRHACLDDVVAARAEGLQAPVGEGGRRLSGGQRKRVALARALLRRPRMLIIDQLATDLEEGLNRRIFENLREHYDLTLVYLGHRIPAGLEPDAVYWMEGGRIRPRSVEVADEPAPISPREHR